MPNRATAAESSLVDGALPKWTDQLQRASFRGVPFHVDSVEWSAGDNVVLREYPFQDLPTVFRMGAAAQDIKFSAYVIGLDYHLQRDLLMAVLTGEGELVHPTAGTFNAFVAGKYAVREAPTTEGGMARFDLHFVRAGPRRYPTAAPATQQTAATRAEEAKTAAAETFASRWSLANKPGWVVDQAVGRITATLEGVIGPIRNAARTLNTVQSEINGAYRSLVGGLNGLLAAPRQLADAVLELYRLPQDLSQAAVRDFQAAFAWAHNLDERLPRKPFETRVMPAVGAGLVIYGTGQLEAVPSDTPGQRQVAELTAAGDALFETVATAAWVQATAALELTSYDDALALRAQAHAQFVRLLETASTADAPASVPAGSLHDALLSLHGAALADLQARSRELVRLSTYTPEAWMPVWVVSHRVHGTTAYADEILAMNPHITHPLLVPPGRPLRIVRHD
jgi:prophage DNA circulation protein